MIVAIGAQNAFVIKQAMKGRHVFAVALVCALCDASLILLGSLGVGTFIATNKYLELTMSVVGCLFLAFYAVTSLKQAFISNEIVFEKDQHYESLKRIVLVALAFSFLNPHAWLDTVVIIGSVSSQYEKSVELAAFTFGACLVSFLWFFFLAFLAKKLRTALTSARTQKYLNLFIAALMASISFGLARHALSIW